MITRYWVGDRMDESPNEQGYRAWVYENWCSLWPEGAVVHGGQRWGPPDKRFAQAWVYLEDRQ